MLARIITKLGHRTDACADPLEAIEQYTFRNYDLVISDYMMNPDGIAVLRAFEGHRCLRVLLTASYTNHEMSDALRSGVVHLVLTKPATLDDFRRVISYASAR